MDHKRVYGTLDHNSEQIERVKRLKDYKYQQHTYDIEFKEVKGKNSKIENIQPLQLCVPSTSLDQLRSIAKKSSNCILNIPQTTKQNHIEKALDQIVYEEYLPILINELSIEKQLAGSQWPDSLMNKGVQKYCKICSNDSSFRGWEALLIHAAKYYKEKTRQHRGYFRAIKEGIQQIHNINLKILDICEGPTSPSSRSKFSNDKQICCFATPNDLTSYSEGENEESKSKHEIERKCCCSPNDENKYREEETRQDTWEAEQLKLCKPLEEHRQIFDQYHFSDKAQILVNKWKQDFKYSLAKIEENSNDHQNNQKEIIDYSKKFDKEVLKLSIQPNLNNDSCAYELKKNQRFFDKIEKYVYLNPSNRKKVKDQLSILEIELRKNKLLWLQEVEAVREQFQVLADFVNDEQIEQNGTIMHVEKHISKHMENLRVQLYNKKKNLAKRTSQFKQNVIQIQEDEDLKGLIKSLREEQRTFEKECKSATRERLKILNLHMKIHARAIESRKRQCPSCLERLEPNL